MATHRIRCIHTTFIVFNVLLFLTGGAALGAGIWAIAEHDDLMTYLSKATFVYEFMGETALNMKTLTSNAVYLLIATGIVAIVIAAVGFCLERMPYKRLLQTYMWSLMFISIIGFALSLTITVISSSVFAYLYTYMQLLLQSEYNSHLSMSGSGGVYTYSYANNETLAADIIQLKFGCCGVLNGSDFKNATLWKTTMGDPNATMIIPATCCQMNEPMKLSNALKQSSSVTLTLANSTCPFTSYDSNYNMGCYSVVRAELRMLIQLINGIGMTVMVILMVLNVVAMFVYRSEFKYKVMP